MNVKRVYLHFGISKTGSTSIQKTLFTNYKTLEKYGYRYLYEWKENHRTAFTQFFKTKSTKNIISKQIRNKYEMALLKKLTNAINTTNCETLILSGDYWLDYFLDSTVENLKNFILKHFESRGIETKIFIFIRNPLTWMISHLQQRITTGIYRRNSDLVEIRINNFSGIINLKKHFNDSLILKKFEDGITDEYGLVGYFLKSIEFPKEHLPEINMVKANESRSLEVMEFINYIEDREPVYRYNKYRIVNINREYFGQDLTPIIGIKGLKFDLHYRDKLALWDRLKGTILQLQKGAGIDYSDFTPSPPGENYTVYSEDTIHGFIDAFPELSPVLQKLFLSFFEKKYSETLNPKYKKLYFKGSIPRDTYNSLGPFTWFIWYIGKYVHKTKYVIKTIRKHILGRSNGEEKHA